MTDDEVADYLADALSRIAPKLDALTKELKRFNDHIDEERGLDNADDT